MSLPLALQGARVEILQLPGVVPKLRRFFALSTLVAKEVVGTLSFAHYGLRALCLHRGSSFLQPLSKTLAPVTTIVRNARYGPKPRNLIDVYPAQGADLAPVVLFVHGGVWSSGERWQYAPLAQSLSSHGVTACVMSYTLFPDASVADIAQEVNGALDWVMANLDASNVTLVGHSAGAHTAIMATLERAKSVKKMPDRVVAMCGVYDIARHYDYERDRGVHELSTMKRAMGGAECFEAQSPTRILSSISTSTPCAGGIDCETLRRLPPILLMSSKVDTTVPSSQSGALHRALKRHGCQSEFILYEGIPHSYFATMAWTNALYRDVVVVPEEHTFVSEFISAVKGDKCPL